MNILTLVHGRRDHLVNLIKGLERSADLPDALVIVQMNEEPQRWESNRFPIVHRAVNSASGMLPLAAARNAAVRYAPGDDLVFLDVDCIPEARLITRYREELTQNPHGILQGQTRYLPPRAVGVQPSDDELRALGTKHPVHESFKAGDALPHHLFWSLNFACRREVFQRIGGFGERFVGYGGEDTDFAFRAAQANVPITCSSAVAFHQFHASFDPPLNHLSSIVVNANLFRKRWGVWPMDGWLRHFVQAGYISQDDDQVTIVRHPSPDAIQMCKVGDDSRE